MELVGNRGVEGRIIGTNKLRMARATSIPTERALRPMSACVSVFRIMPTSLPVRSERMTRKIDSGQAGFEFFDHTAWESGTDRGRAARAD
jgi:hypothetical protein